VSELAFGGWQLGGDWGRVDDGESIKTLLHAYDRVINFVDTAELYGRGHSEEVIGESLRQWRGDKIYVATKVQPTVWPDPDDDEPAMRGRYPAWHLRAAVDAALDRLGVDHVDLLQLHGWFRSGTDELDWLETLNALRAAGKIDQIGVSIRDYRPDEGVVVAQLGLVASIQVVFDMFEQRPADALSPPGRPPERRSSAVSRSTPGHWSGIGTRTPTPVGLRAPYRTPCSGATGSPRPSRASSGSRSCVPRTTRPSPKPRSGTASTPYRSPP
jgi:hypothetical protein